jgi:hypothetical protein
VAGEGSKQKPVSTIAAALLLVPFGGRIALASGTYDEPLVPTISLEIVGRCPSMVTIRGVTDAFGPSAVAVDTTPIGVTLRRLRLEGPGVGLMMLDGNGLLERVIVAKARLAGLYIQGKSSNLSVDHSLIRDTSDTDLGAGLYVSEGGHAELKASTIV